MSWSKNQNEYRPQFGGFTFFPPVIKYVIIANVIVYMLQQLLTGGFTMNGEPLSYWFKTTFYLMPIDEGFMPWQLVSYMFLHGGFWHIFMNMLMLWMFGVEVEYTWGTRKFLVFYFVCGISAGLANLFVAPLFAEAAPTIGASGSVYGVLMAFGMMFPNRLIYIYFMIPVKAKYMIAFLFALEFMSGFFGGEAGSGVAHFAHLGGAVVAIIWVLFEQRGKLDGLLGMKRRKVQTSKPMYQWGSPPVSQADFKDSVSQQANETRVSGDDEEYQRVIDQILDKISKSGYSGLTETEKQMLLDASRKMPKN
jgi:membrane associated rhomboid family serine protease